MQSIKWVLFYNVNYLSILEYTLRILYLFYKDVFVWMRVTKREDIIGETKKDREK